MNLFIVITKYYTTSTLLVLTAHYHMNQIMYTKDIVQFAGLFTPNTLPLVSH